MDTNYNFLSSVDFSKSIDIEVNKATGKLNVTYLADGQISKISNEAFKLIHKTLDEQVPSLEGRNLTQKEAQELNNVRKIITNVDHIFSSNPVEQPEEQPVEQAQVSRPLTLDDMLSIMHFDGSDLTPDELKFMNDFTKQIPHLNRMRVHWEMLKETTEALAKIYSNQSLEGESLEGEEPVGQVAEQGVKPSLMAKQVQKNETPGIPKTISIAGNEFDVHDITDKNYLLSVHASRFRDTPIVLQKFVEEEDVINPNMCVTIIDEKHHTFQPEERLILMLSMDPNVLMHSATRDIGSPWVFRFDPDTKKLVIDEVVGPINRKYANFSKKSIVLFGFLDQIYKNANISTIMSSDYERANRLRVMIADYETNLQSLDDKDLEAYELAKSDLLAIENKYFPDQDVKTEELKRLKDMKVSLEAELKKMKTDNAPEADIKELEEVFNIASNKLKEAEDRHERFMKSVLGKDPPHFKLDELIRHFTELGEQANNPKNFKELFGYEDPTGANDILKELSKLDALLNQLDKDKEILYPGEKPEKAPTFMYHYSHLLSPKEVVDQTYTAVTPTHKRGMRYNEVNIDIPQGTPPPFKVCGVILNQLAIDKAEKDEQLAKEIANSLKSAQKNNLPIFIRNLNSEE